MADQSRNQRLWEQLGLQVMIEEYQHAVADTDAPPVGVEATRRYYARYALKQENVPHDGQEPACRKGCSYCCHTRVSAPAQEVFVLADAITRLPQERRDQVLERLASNAASVDAMGPATHFRTPMACALLDSEGACGAYQDRPSNCRRYHSMRVDDCVNSFAAPDDQTSKIRLSTPLLIVNVSQYLGYRKVLVESGVDTTYFELNTALREVLADPQGCRDRFAAGQKAFVHAVICVPNGTMI